MRILFITVFLTFFITGVHAQSVVNKDPHVYFKKHALQIEPKGWTIVFYHVSLQRKGKTDLMGPYTYSRGKTSKEAVNLLQNAKPGDKIFIDEIKAQGPDGKTFSISPITTNLE